MVQRRWSLGFSPCKADSIDWRKWDKLLGTDTDQAIADLIGCYVKTVKLRRLSLGIPVCRKRSIDWNYWDSFLGTMTDAKLAKKIGCSKFTVMRRRNYLKIERYGQ